MKLKPDVKGKFHRPNGQFAKREEIKIHLNEINYPIDEKVDFYYKDFSWKSYEKYQKSYQQQTLADLVETFNLNVPKKMGKYVTLRYAYLFECTCQSKKYHVKIQRKDGSIKEYSRENNEVFNHYVYLSSNSKDDYYIRETFYDRHLDKYPNHVLLSATLKSIHEGEVIE